MKELLYALPAGCENAGTSYGLIPAHMTYRVDPGPKLSGVGLTAEVRGGAMYVACGADLAPGDPQHCCRQVLGECRARGFDRVICDFEGSRTEAMEALCPALGRALAQNGLVLYLPEPLAELVPGCRVLISSSMVSGTLERRLAQAVERCGADRVVLAVEAGARDYPLPAAGQGVPMTSGELKDLMARLEPAVFFDRGLCAHYFTYMARGGKAHFILFDTARSVREKLDAAQRLGVPSALLAAPEVGDWVGEIFG